MDFYATIQPDFGEYGGKSGQCPLFVFYKTLPMTAGTTMDLEKISEELKALTERLGFEYVGMEAVKEAGENILRLYADREGGISLDDCEKIAGEANAFLDEKADEIEGNYLFEVSSPGLDRPLFKLEDYARFVGRVANVRLKCACEGRKRFQATIEGVRDENVQFDSGGEPLDVPFAAIMSARLAYIEQKGQKKTFRKNGGKK